MNTVGTRPVDLYASQHTNLVAAETKQNVLPDQLKVEQNKVTLSDEGKALLAALQQIDRDAQKTEQSDKSVGDQVESFAHGALGMDHPDEIKEEGDGSYSAGQYVSALATVGGILLAIA